MLALCLMLSGTYYARNYAGIIGASLLSGPHDLDESKVDNNFITPSTEIVTLLSGGMGG